MTGLLGALAAIVAAVLAALGWGVRLGKRREADRQNAETLERVTAGLDAAGKAAASKLSPEEIARAGDGKWQ